MWEEGLGTQAGVHLIEGVRLIRGPLNTGFTVLIKKQKVMRFIPPWQIDQSKFPKNVKTRTKNYLC